MLQNYFRDQIKQYRRSESADAEKWFTRSAETVAACESYDRQKKAPASLKARGLRLTE
jgi:hypothetical protein